MKLWRNENFCRFSGSLHLSVTQAFTSFLECSTELAPRLLVAVVGGTGASDLSEWTRFRCEKQFPELATAIEKGHLVFKLSDGVEVQTKQKLLLTSFRAVWTLIWKTIIKQLTHWIWLIIFSILCFGYVPHMALLLCADLCGISNLDYVWTFSYKCYICAVECCCEKSHAVSTYCWMDKLGHMFDTRTFHPNDIPCAVANWFVF